MVDPAGDAAGVCNVVKCLHERTLLPARLSVTPRLRRSGEIGSRARRCETRPPGSSVLL